MNKNLKLVCNGIKWLSSLLQMQIIVVEFRSVHLPPMTFNVFFLKGSFIPKYVLKWAKLAIFHFKTIYMCNKHIPHKLIKAQIPKQSYFKATGIRKMGKVYES